ncbi:MAG: mechanosensitive ion channel domain-containing protein [Pseudomonadota bacterium]
MKRYRSDASAFFIAALRLMLFLPAFLITTGAAVLSAEAPPPISSFKDYNQSVLETIDKERETIGRYKEQLSAGQALWDSLKGEINAYRLQLSAHGNLLLTPATEIEPLEKAAVENRTALEQVDKRLKNVTGQIETLTEAFAKNEEQFRFNGEQLSQIKTQKQDDRDARTLVKNLEILVKTLSDKQRAIETLQSEYGKEKTTLEEILNALTGLSKTFEEKIEEKKKEKLFQRRDTPLKVTQFGRIAEETRQVRQKISQITSLEYWRNELKSIWELEGFRLFSFFLLLILTLIFLARINLLTRKLASRPFYSQHPWRLLAFRIFSRSLPLLGILLIFNLFKKVWNIHDMSVFSLFQCLLWIILSMRWSLDALRFLTHSEHLTLRLPNLSLLRLLVFSAGGFALAYVLMDWMIEGISSTLLAFRAIFEMGLVLWGIHLRKKMRRLKHEPGSPLSALPRATYPISIGLGYIVICTGPLLELIGFGEFALYWYLSWARTAIVFLWAGLLVMVLREWDQKAHLTEKQVPSSAVSQAQPVRWVIFRICWLAWATIFFFALFFAWGARQQVIDGFIQLLKYPVKIGEMQLSLMGLLYAFLTLFFTHLTVKTCRYLLKEKLLVKSGVDRGLQESITNITTYLIWGLGILMALHAVGFNTASLAVVLGALGIGLGFGLQNIFNNFVSGIILLFERPIQAGDDVEINGVWATVKKINVRSTIVQTYDNASLIIPNSDFISNQVTNWSFKDRRLRRKITIGVAYGTDTGLVKDTLLEIADAMPQVLKYPAADVLFSDFADSALIFTLRIWTTIDHALKLESEIRYEIDRLFKERNISIAFPQQDVHLYHMNIPPQNPGQAEENGT